MALSESRKKANTEYNRRQDNIMLRPSKELGAAIRQAAAESGQSLQQYILQAVQARMDTESSQKNETASSGG